MKSPLIDETATNMSYKVNGFAHATNVQAHGNQSSANGRSISVKKSHSKDSNDSQCDRKENPHHQTNGSTELSNGIHSSPLRTQLGLNLKSSTTTTPVKKPIISPMTVCSYLHLTTVRNTFDFSTIFIHIQFPVSTVPIFIRQCNNSRGTHQSNAF